MFIRVENETASIDHNLRQVRTGIIVIIITCIKYITRYNKGI